MGRRKKNRTHLKGAGAIKNAPEATKSTPKSFIVKHGPVGRSLSQLVRDMRKVMEPNTASKLKERSRNRLKDYLTLAPSLNVSHLLAFTLTPIAPSLRVVRLSDGPTLSFRIERYSLMKDILHSSRHSRSIGMEYLSPPLLVLASFPPPGPDTPPHMNLLVKSFQSLFPPLSPKALSLSSARRVVLVSWNAQRATIDFRHYLITVKTHGISRRVRKVVESATKGSTSKVLDLGREKDVADYLLRSKEDEGYETASTSAASEADPEEISVRLAADYVGRNNKKGEKRAIRLDEIGPRMELRLVKITEGAPGKEGAVMFHEFVNKAPKEVAALRAEAAERAKIRKQRREEQERNVARKKAAAAEGKGDEAKPTEEDAPSEQSAAEDEVEEEYDDWDENEEVSDRSQEEGEESASEDESIYQDQPTPKRRRHGK